MEKTNPKTGLTPQQEKAASLILSGKTITDVSKELKVDRTTIYRWADKMNFQAFLNKLRSEVQEHSKAGVFGLYDDAIRSLKECLNSNNLSVKLKASEMILEKIEKAEIGHGNIHNWIKAECTRIVEFEPRLNTKFDEIKFDRLCSENKIPSNENR